MKKLLIDIVMHPRKYKHIANMPGRYDAAFQLYNEFINELTDRVYKKCVDILMKSGCYVKGLDSSLEPSREVFDPLKAIWEIRPTDPQEVEYPCYGLILQNYYVNVHFNYCLN